MCWSLVVALSLVVFYWWPSVPFACRFLSCRSLKINCATSCPARKGRMASSGTWSIDCLNDHYDEEACIVISTKKKRS